MAYQASALPLSYMSKIHLVSPRGIEPRSEALQATAMTTSAKATNIWGVV